jgi:hydrogenase maturation factor HypF (carbamoyltransferase family)
MNLIVYREEEKIFESGEKTATEAFESVRKFVSEYYKENNGKLTIKEVEIVGNADENRLIWKCLE